MFFGFIVLALGAWLVDASVKNRAPLQTLKDIIKSPSDYQATLQKNTGSGFAVPVAPVAGGTGNNTPLVSPGSSGSAQGIAAVAFAQSKHGLPYRWGATGPNAYDCSGLVQAAYKSVGVNLPRTSYQMLTVGKHIDRANLQVGDLVWPDLGHVGLYAGNGQFTEAPRTGVPVRTVPMYGFFTARRVA